MLAPVALRLHNRVLMRRALLLAALAAPAIATAQTATPGTILFADNGGTDYVHGPYINQAECTGGAQVSLTWNVGTTSIPTNATYQVYASSQPHPQTGGCTTQGDTTKSPVVYAGAVGGPVSATTSTQTQAYTASQFTTAANVACTTTADTPIYVCVQLSSGSTVLTAKATITLSTSPPDVPGGVGASPDDSAARVTWSLASRANDYQVRLQSLADKTGADLATPDPLDPNPHTARSAQNANNLRMGGLVNGVTYRVNVASYSLSNTASAWSSDTPPVLVMPTPVNDFWEEYKRLGGQDSGGCGAGGAGPLALFGVAALVAALRRRA